MREIDLAAWLERRIRRGPEVRLAEVTGGVAPGVEGFRPGAVADREAREAPADEDFRGGCGFLNGAFFEDDLRVRGGRSGEADTCRREAGWDARASGGAKRICRVGWVKRGQRRAKRRMLGISSQAPGW
jgi:hypothetical protein